LTRASILNSGNSTTQHGLPDQARQRRGEVRFNSIGDMH
jgi:hypothetical protein